MTNPIMSKLVTRKEAADRLRVSTKTIYRFQRQGLLAAIVLSSRCIRYDAGDVEKLIYQAGGGK
jgi:predicted site-specific integrase-resolvase